MTGTMRHALRGWTAAGTLLLACGLVFGGPRLVVEAESLDLGTVVKGDEVAARFVLRNEGDEELKILRAKPG